MKGKRLLIAGAAFALAIGAIAGVVTSNNASALYAAENTSTLSFTSACGGSGTADDGVAWTITSDASESSFDNTKGIHYGTSNAAVSYINLSTSGISGTIKRIVVNASGASGTSAKLDVTVGGNAFGSQQSLTSSATSYTLTGSASGDILVALTQSSAKKAIYCKSIVVTYFDGSNEPLLSFSDDTINGEEGDEFSFTYQADNLTSGITWSPASNETDIINYNVNETSKTVSGTLSKAGSVTLTATSGNVSDSILFTVLKHENNRIFTVTGTSSVSGSGDTMTGAEATYSQTYGTSKQATGGNHMTLSISGLAKKVTINKLVLSMHSNAGAGAGSISVKTDNNSASFIAGTSSSSGVGFNEFGDNSVYGNTYRNVTWSNLNYVAKSSIEITIYCTTNSLFCESYDIFFSEQENDDVVTSVTLSNNMNTTSYTTADAWKPDGLTVTATYEDLTTVDVTSHSSFSFYSDSAMTDEVPTPLSLGVGNGQTIYVKATFSQVSNTVGYSQIVSVSEAPIFVADLTVNPATVSSGFEISSSSHISPKTGYYQDGGTADSEVNYFIVTSDQTLPNPGQKALKLIARLGGSEDKDPLDHNVEVCLVDSNGDEIEGTKVILATALTHEPADVDVLIPYSASAYGVKLMHVKENGWNARYYSFSLIYVEADINEYIANSSSILAINGVERTTVSSVVTNISASQLGLGNDTALEEVNKDGFTLVGDKGSNPSGTAPKYYTNGTNLRFYIGNTLTISTAHPITKIEFTFTSSYDTGLVASEGTLNGGVWTGSATSITFTNSHTSENNKQIRITDLSITAEKDLFQSVDTLSLRFGASIPQADWQAIKTNWGIIDYGVMLIKTNASYSPTDESNFAKEAFLNNYGILVVNKRKNNADYADPYLDNGNYSFSVKVNLPDDASHTVVYYAVPFICVGDENNNEYKFLSEMHGSVRTIAENHTDSNLSTDALNYLKTH